MSYAMICAITWLFAQNHSDVVTSVAMALDGKIALSAAADGSLAMWNLESGTLNTMFSETPKTKKKVFCRRRCSCLSNFVASLRCCHFVAGAQQICEDCTDE